MKLTHVLSMTAFSLKQQVAVGATETVLDPKLNYLLPGPLQENFAESCISERYIRHLKNMGEIIIRILKFDSCYWG